MHGKARIEAIDTAEIERRFAEGQVAVVAGFQGMGPRGRITTLGRGGSDTSAVALAAALKADRCDIFTDVDGVYTTDPRIVAKARKLARITYEEMLEMASQGAQGAADALGRDGDEPSRARSRCCRALPTSPERSSSTRTRSWKSRSSAASPTAATKPRSPCSGWPIAPASRPRIFGPLADNAINVDMIVQNVSEDGRRPT